MAVGELNSLMRPVDFLLPKNHSRPNEPYYKVAEALEKALVIRSVDRTWKVSSYYLDGNGQMTIDIEPFGNT
jgi:hypothetical protein